MVSAILKILKYFLFQTALVMEEEECRQSPKEEYLVGESRHNNLSHTVIGQVLLWSAPV